MRARNVPFSPILEWEITVNLPSEFDTADLYAFQAFLDQSFGRGCERTAVKQRALHRIDGDNDTKVKMLISRVVSSHHLRTEGQFANEIVISGA